MTEVDEKLELAVIKRNGKKVDFDGTKIALAIKKGFDSVNEQDEETGKFKYDDTDITKVYNEVIPFWGGKAGALGNNLYTMVYWIKETFYTKLRLGHAAAASIILFLIIFVFTMLQKWIQKKFDY